MFIRPVAVYFFGFIFTGSFCACPFGLLQWQDHCYYISYNRMKWTDAERFCANGGGHLASIENNIENSFLTDQLAEMDNANADNIWNGGNNLEAEDGTSWQWSDGKPFSFTKWKPGFPNNAALDQCISQDQSVGLWSNENCHQSKHFICKFDENDFIGASPASPTPPFRCPTCPLGYEIHLGFCYRVFRISLSWLDAEDACIREGGHLASIHTMAENTFLLGLILAQLPHTGTPTCQDDQWTWIGLWEPREDGTYAWTDGTNITIINWPGVIDCADAGSGIRCVELWHPLDGGLWKLKPCSQRNTFYICKMPMQ